LQLSPADVPTADVFQRAIARNDLRFLVRELRARVGAYYARREEIGGWQMGVGAGMPTIREDADGCVAIELPCGLRCVLQVDHDYPRPHALLRIARWEGGASVPPAVLARLRGAPPGDRSVTIVQFATDLLERFTDISKAQADSTAS
jgi:hypothetical protein